MELITTKELCDRLKISRWQIHRLIEAGTLTHGTHYFDLRLSQSQKALRRWNQTEVLRTLTQPPRTRRR